MEEKIQKLQFHKGMRALMIGNRPIMGQKHEVYISLISYGIRDADKLYDKLVELQAPLYWGKTKAEFASEFNVYLKDESDDGEGLSPTSRARRGDLWQTEGLEPSRKFFFSF